jgi:hypothetical protein
LVSPFQRTNPSVQSVSKPHRGRGSRTAKHPILIDGDEAGFAELMTEQQEWMMKALGTFAEAVVAKSGKILGGYALWSTATATSVRTTPQTSRRPLMDRS